MDRARVISIRNRAEVARAEIRADPVIHGITLELRVVPDVEHLPAELSIDALGDLGVLEDPHVPVVDSGLLDGVPAGIALHVNLVTG